jgi:hypothetical protein
MRPSILVAAALSVAPMAALAQLAEPSPVPAAPDAELDRLTHERADLLARFDDLRARLAEHNARCSHVARTDEALTAACMTAQADVRQRLTAYKTQLSTYEADPMVVDARNVPSGLPPWVDAQLPHGPAGDRVRKGYEAVQAHDWKVARAWFQDAQNHAPGDAGIARLVDLALEAEARQDHAGAHGTAVLNRYLDLQLRPDFQPAWNAFVHDYIPQHPQLTADVRSVLFDVTPRALTDIDFKARVEQLQGVSDREWDLEGKALPDGSSATDLQSALFVLHGHLEIAIDERLRAVKACHCEPPPFLQKPEDKDMELLFPGLGR